MDHDLPKLTTLTVQQENSSKSRMGESPVHLETHHSLSNGYELELISSWCHLNSVWSYLVLFMDLSYFPQLQIIGSLNQFVVMERFMVCFKNVLFNRRCWVNSYTGLSISDTNSLCPFFVNTNQIKAMCSQMSRLVLFFRWYRNSWGIWLMDGGVTRIKKIKKIGAKNLGAETLGVEIRWQNRVTK